MPSVNLGLAIQRQMISVLGDQDLGDQRLGRNAALDDPRRCGGLRHRALARAAAITRAARNQHAKSGRHDIEPLGDVFADQVERPPATGACPDAIDFRDVDDLLDPLKVGGQRAAVDLTGIIALGALRSCVTCSARLTQRGLDILKTKLQLFGIELLGTGAETMAHEGVDDRLQPLYLGVGLTFGERRIGKLARLLQGERPQRFDVLGQVGFGEHGSE